VAGCCEEEPSDSKSMGESWLAERMVVSQKLIVTVE
jgi:hypothetical protein